MDKVRVFHDTVGKTLSVWFDDPAREEVCEEADDKTIVRKNAQGHVIGFEKLRRVDRISLGRSLWNCRSPPQVVSAFRRRGIA